METRDMVRMANQIAEFFTPYPQAEAIDSIAKHIHAFWDPRMRDKLKTYLDAGGKDLSPLFVTAATQYFSGPAKRKASTPKD